MKNIIPIILIAVSIGTFFLFVNPTYQQVQALQKQQTAYDTALGNSKKLQAVRDQLVAKYNGLPKENLDRLQKFLPDNVDNIRLIIEIQQIAAKYGMNLKDVKFEPVKKDDAAAAGAIVSDAQTLENQKPYGTFNLELSTEGTYANFLLFLKDMEHSLRLVDLDGISFTADKTGTGLAGNYKFDIKVKTYWLKN
jgi:Tfp pilus assembly protein PilO